MIILIILFPCAVFLIVFHLQWHPFYSSIHLDSKLPTTQSQSIRDNLKNDIYQQCKTFSQRIYLSQPPLSNNHQTKTSQDVYLLIHYSPRKDDEGGLYLQIATSYLLSQNLQRLSPQQQNHTHLTIFLHKNYANVMYKRLKQWFESIFIPYTSTIDIIPLKNNNQSLWKLMRNYIKSNKNIHYDTILFFLQDDYIFEKEMLFDTIDFFLSHEPCFIYQTDYSDRCGFDMTDGFGHLLIPGKTRLWRSISSTTISYACRLKTFLAFEDVLMNTMNNLKLNQKIRAEVDGQDVFFCAIPSYSARIETLLLPDEVNINKNDDMAIYYKDWWSMARHALTEAQKKESFPCPKINERNLF